MSAVIRPLRPVSSVAHHETATVVSRVDDKFVVDTGSATHHAARAVGCLVCPDIGDLVLIARSERGAWVLTTLERDGGAATRIVVEGDLELELASGKLGVRAEEGIAMASAAPVTMVAPELHVHAKDGEVAIEKMAFLGGAVQIDVGTVRVVAAAVDQIVDRLTQRLDRAYRFVKGVDQVKAGHIDYVAEKVLGLHGENTALTAKELVKVDGAQIHVG